VESALSGSQLVLDGLIGYGLNEAPQGRTAELIRLCNSHAKLVQANDVPSGIDSTGGLAPGAVIRADRILTLAAPKTGLQAFTQSLYLADIGIPPALYNHLGIAFSSPSAGNYWVRLVEAAGFCIGVAALSFKYKAQNTPAFRSNSSCVPTSAIWPSISTTM